LGASQGDVLRIVFGYAGLLMTVGLVIGIAAAAAAGRAIETQLFDVKPGDPATFVMVAAVLFATGLLACAIPAGRAMRVDPLVALRND
jgi:putative ABC transport system permease protein